jgi:hypothetical protein
MTHTMTVILPWLNWEVYSLTFLWRRGAVFLVKKNYSRYEYFVFILVQGYSWRNHPCRRGKTTWTLTEKIGKFTVILSRPFHFAILL